MHECLFILCLLFENNSQAYENVPLIHDISNLRQKLIVERGLKSSCRVTQTILARHIMKISQSFLMKNGY